jgi:hypothetical protein
MSSFKNRPISRTAAKNLSDRIQLVEMTKRFYWRFVPGSKATLELAYGAETLDENHFLHAPVVGCVRRVAMT